MQWKQRASTYSMIRHLRGKKKDSYTPRWIEPKNGLCAESAAVQRQQQGSHTKASGNTTTFPSRESVHRRINDDGEDDSRDVLEAMVASGRCGDSVVISSPTVTKPNKNLVFSLVGRGLLVLRHFPLTQ